MEDTIAVYDAAIDDVQAANSEFEKDGTEALQAQDLEATQAAAAKFMEARETFVSTLESLEFPAEVQPDVDDVIIANEGLLGALRTVEDATQFVEAEAALQVAVDLTAETGEAGTNLSEKLADLKES